MISDFLNPKERKGAFYRNDQQQPNIVFITVDMISADCYHPQRPLSGVINTPNIESIATEGTSFSSAFTPSLYAVRQGPLFLLACTLPIFQTVNVRL